MNKTTTTTISCHLCCDFYSDPEEQEQVWACALHRFEGDGEDITEKNVAAAPHTPRRDFLSARRSNCATDAARDYARCGAAVREDHLTGRGDVWAGAGRGITYIHMGAACGKWSEVAACVQTSEAGLRTRWFTVMDTAAASRCTKVTLAAVSARAPGSRGGGARRRSPAAASSAAAGSVALCVGLLLSTCVCVDVCGRGR